MGSLELIEQQHLESQELIRENQIKTEQLLSDIIDALSVEKNNDDIVKAITDNISIFVEQVKEIKPPEVTVKAPVVNVSPIVNVNQEKVILSLESVAEKLEGLKPKPVEKKLEKWNFDFIRNSEGAIISATANQIK